MSHKVIFRYIIILNCMLFFFQTAAVIFFRLLQPVLLGVLCFFPHGLRFPADRRRSQQAKKYFGHVATQSNSLSAQTKIISYTVTQTILNKVELRCKTGNELKEFTFQGNQMMGNVKMRQHSCTPQQTTITTGNTDHP